MGDEESFLALTRSGEACGLGRGESGWDEALVRTIALAA